jgi:uncharacterized repeat protein (TIGR03803 family)
MSKSDWWIRARALFFVCAIVAVVLPAQTFTTLHNFDGRDGAYPWAGLVQASDGNYYGTTRYGGANDTCANPFGNGCGAIYKITANGNLTTIHSFDGTDGDAPSAVLVQAANGDFYGTTYAGGAHGVGTVFKMTPSGSLTTLYNFCSQTNCADGALPEAGLVLGPDGNFYGTTYEGGGHYFKCKMGCGAVFTITPGGTLTTLHKFDRTHGSYPEAPLVADANGSLYGTTDEGGGQGCHVSDGCGTVFKITSTGAFTMLYRFDGPHGAEPATGALILGTDGSLYGTTFSGGGNGSGTVFRISTSGKLTTLYRFCSQSGCTDGAHPYAGLVRAADGNFYGTTEVGGTHDCPGGITCGTVFNVTPSGKLTTLHSFDTMEGVNPLAGLVQGSNGTFYGTTINGGNHTACGQYGCGTVFSLSVGSGPFANTLRGSGGARAVK